LDDRNGRSFALEAIDILGTSSMLGEEVKPHSIKGILEEENSDRGVVIRPK